MGLSASHGCWSGSYSFFSAWRTELARAAGFPVVPDEKYGGDSYKLPWDDYPRARYAGEGWAEAPVGDALLYLLVHSDCDGVIHPSEGLALAARLGELLPLLPPDGNPTGLSFRHLTEQFLAGLREAAAAGEDVEFR